MSDPNPVLDIAGPDLDELIYVVVMGNPPLSSMQFRYPPAPPYSTDISAAFAMESEIERRGLVSEYVEALCEIFYPGDQLAETHEDAFKFIHASPLDRCRAALAAVRVGKEK